MRAGNDNLSGLSDVGGATSVAATSNDGYAHPISSIMGSHTICDYSSGSKVHGP